jgi:signal transduction histidine kinase/HD-like signal output (HDOD) protein
MTYPRSAGDGGALDLPFSERVLVRLLALLQDPGRSSSELTRVVLCDPVLTVHLLAAGEPMARDSSPPAGWVERRLTSLGPEALHVLALHRAGASLRAGVADARFVLERVRGRALLCAEAARVLARETAGSVENAHLAGLLAYVGRLVLLASAGERYQRLLETSRRDEDLIAGERDLVGTTHAAEGARWLADAGLPALLADAVAFAQEPIDLLEDAPAVVRIARVAAALASQGASDEAQLLGLRLLGLEGDTVRALFDEASGAAAGNAAGVPIEPSAKGASLHQALFEASSDRTLQGVGRARPAEPGALVTAFADSALRLALERAFGPATARPEALARLRRLVRRTTGARRTMIFAADASRRRLAVEVPEALAADTAAPVITLPGSRSVLARAWRDRNLQRVDAAALAAGPVVDRVVARILESDGFLCLPLGQGDAPLGILAVAAPGGRLGFPADEQLLDRLAGAARDAVASAERQVAETDRVRGELAERYRSLGRSIVHEAGNPLGIVRNYLKLMADKLADAEGIRPELEIVNQELDRVMGILRRMSDPMAAEAAGPARLDLNAVVTELMKLSRDTLFSPRGIEVVQQFDPSLPLLQLDPVAVKQVTLNVLRNAADAMGSGGRLGVMTADQVNLGGGMYVLLQITDTGGGVEHGVLERLFQEEGSTKGEGHEGIGLAVSAGLLRDMGGHIMCRSSASRGTIFLILLPRRVHPDGATAVAPPSSST